MMIPRGLRSAVHLQQNGRFHSNLLPYPAIGSTCWSGGGWDEKLLSISIHHSDHASQYRTLASGCTVARPRCARRWRSVGTEDILHCGALCVPWEGTWSRLHGCERAGPGHRCRTECAGQSDLFTVAPGSDPGRRKAGFCIQSEARQHTRPLCNNIGAQP